MNDPTNPKNQMLRTILLILITLVVGGVFISHQAFWMDEGGPAFKALMPTLRDWWDMSMRLGGSDTQMPVYMVSLWAWEKLTGPGEWLMRSMNLPWLVLAVLALRRVRYWPLVCLTSPFILYYTGELRPYAMQIAAGAMAAAAMIETSKPRETDNFSGLHATAGASLLLAAGSLTGAIWALGLWIGVLVMRSEWLGKKGFWIRIAPWTLGALALAAYYGFTLLKGFRAAGIDSASILSVFFGFYEMLGLLGLGPGKNDLRGSLRSIFPYLPLLIPAFFCISAAWCLGAGAWMKNTPKRTVVGVACAVILPVLILAAIGQAMNFRVLGRHLSPAMPAVLLPIALSLAGHASWKMAGRIFGVAAVLLGLASATSLRLLERHTRDNYRHAAAVGVNALKARQRVWWQADMNCMRYYAYLEGGMPWVNAVQILESDSPSSLLVTDCVIINRPDLKYRNVDYQKEFIRNSFKLEQTFTGFEVWTSSYR